MCFLIQTLQSLNVLKWNHTVFQVIPHSLPTFPKERIESPFADEQNVIDYHHCVTYVLIQRFKSLKDFNKSYS